MKDYDQIDNDDLLDDDPQFRGTQESAGFQDTAFANLQPDPSNGVSDFIALFKKKKEENTNENTEGNTIDEANEASPSKDNVSNDSDPNVQMDADTVTADTEVASEPVVQQNAAESESATVLGEENTHEVVDEHGSVNQQDHPTSNEPNVEIEDQVEATSNNNVDTEEEPAVTIPNKTVTDEDEEELKDKDITGVNIPEPSTEESASSASVESDTSSTPFSEIRQSVSSNSVSPDLDTNGAAPLHLANDTKYNNMYRTRRSIQGTVKCLKNKNVRNLAVGNSVTYEIDKENNKTTYNVDVFRTKEKIAVTESDNHIEFQGGNHKEQAAILVNYAKDLGWLDLAVWGDARFIQEVKKQGLKHSINVIPVGTKNQALNIKTVPKQEFNIFSSPSLGKHRSKQTATPAKTNTDEKGDSEDKTESKRAKPQDVQDKSITDKIDMSKSDSDSPKPKNQVFQAM
ncbi:hypothetical protein ACNO5E_22500 [Vibrio parahaemolyticus]